MKSVRRLPIIVGIISGVVLVSALMLFEVNLPGTSGPAVTTPADVDPLLSNHRKLMQVSGEYRARLESMNALAGANLVSQKVAAEDLVVSATARLLRESGTPAGTAKAAAARLTESASSISGAASRLGISMGPRITPQLLTSRIKDAEALHQFANAVFEFHTSACVNDLAQTLAEATTSPAPP